MKAPSSKTLLVLAVLFFLGTSAFEPIYYRIPVTGPDGSVVRGPDGMVLTHLDVARIHKEAVPLLICFFCALILFVRLLVRLFRFLYEGLSERKTVV